MDWNSLRSALTLLPKGGAVGHLKELADAAPADDAERAKLKEKTASLAEAIDALVDSVPKSAFEVDAVSILRELPPDQEEAAVAALRALVATDKEFALRFADGQWQAVTDSVEGIPQDDRYQALISLGIELRR